MLIMFYRRIFLFIALISSQHLVGMQPEQQSSVVQQAPVGINWGAWKEMLLTDSSQALTSARKATSEWVKWQDIYNHRASPELLEVMYPATVSQHPFFLLHDTDDGYSFYARKFGKRDIFETAVAAGLTEVIDANLDRAVHYVGFATGHLFSDFLILIKALQSRPNAKIIFSAIDKNYDLNSIHRQENLWVKEQFENCIKSMFPEATFVMNLICNHNKIPEKTAQLLTVKPDLIIASAIPSEEFYKDFLNKIFETSRVANFLLNCGENIAQSLSYVQDNQTLKTIVIPL